MVQKDPPPGGTASQPPAVSGGTLLVTRDDATVVAADPDRDSVWLVDAAKNTLRARVRLEPGSEPGRVVEDADGKVHVALRRGGQLAKIDPVLGVLVSKRSVCAAPRGMAYDAATDNLHVACAGGELVTLKATGGDVIRSLRLDSDLRDVAIKGDHLLISRFRSAELIEVDAAGSVVGRVGPRPTKSTVSNPPMAPGNLVPTTAWRMAPLPGGAVVMLHQRSQSGPVSITRPGGYGGPGPCPCPCGIVNTGMTLFSDATIGSAGVRQGAQLSGASLAVDVAVSRDGDKLALLSPSSGIDNALFGSVPVFSQAQLSDTDACLPAKENLPLNKQAEPIAGAFDGMNRLWVQSRQPAQLHRISTTGAPITVDLNGEDRADIGHRIFHAVTRGNIACASCHAEAGDDNHTWTFDAIGPRRTQSLRGGLFATAPFHWDGDMSDIKTLMSDVFVRRMSGPNLGTEQILAVGKWIDAQPALPKSPPADSQRVLRGKKLFEDAALGCQSCHSGPQHTSNASADVGTGKAFQVPALRDLTTRAPFMHNGCAKTLQARFDPACGGGDRHGKTSHLSSGEIDDLVAYLESL